MFLLIYNFSLTVSYYKINAFTRILNVFYFLTLKNQILPSDLKVTFLQSVVTCHYLFRCDSSNFRMFSTDTGNAASNKDIFENGAFLKKI